MNTVESKISQEQVKQLASIVACHRDWYAREFHAAALHPLVMKCLNLGRPNDWHQLVLEYPHIPDAGERAKVAYTRDDRAGEANRQTVTSLGKYLTRHFSLPDHLVRDIVASADTASCKFVHTTAEMIYHLVRGPGSCMAKEFRHIHPYTVYNPARGWHMAVRLEGGDTVGRALCMNDGGHKYFVRSYKKTEGYSYSDEVLEAWLKDQGYEHYGSWEDCTLDYIEDKYGDGFVAPYLDGDVQNVDLCNDGAGNYLKITSYGEYECTNTDGTVSVGEACADCDDRISEGDGYWVGRHEDSYVCSGCIDSYRYAYGRRGSQYYVNEDDAIYVESQDEYYDPDYLEDNDIVTLDNGDYEHQDNAILIESRGDWVHRDSDEWVGLPDGTHERRDDCVELANGDWCLESDAWQCEESGRWYHNDDEYVEIDGGKYHPNSETAMQFGEEAE